MTISSRIRILDLIHTSLDVFDWGDVEEDVDFIRNNYAAPISPPAL